VRSLAPAGITRTSTGEEAGDADAPGSVHVNEQLMSSFLSRGT
jgi:hypothetical protein